MDSSLWRSNLRLFCTLFCTVSVLSFVNSDYPKPYNDAVHYWPLDWTTGLRDVITNKTGFRDGRDRSLYFKGPRPGYLFVSQSRLKLGTFKGTCVVDPSKCSDYLTVSFWVKYSRKGASLSRTQFFIGTPNHKTGSPGFVIQAAPSNGHEERVRFQISNQRMNWTAYTDVKHDTWTQVGFSWSESTGLVVYKNCERVQSVTHGHLRTSTGSIGKHLYLVKAPGRGKAAFNISYDDIAVWYKELRQVDKGLVCSKKVDPPVLFNRCYSGPTWIFIQWKPSSPDYGILTGFNVRYRCTSKNWTEQTTERSSDSFNITGLDPSSDVEIQIQNKIHGGSGQSSQKIVCKSSSSPTKVLGSPLNLTVEATSSRAILMSWKPPVNNKEIKGYWVLYKDINSTEKFTKLEVGLPENDQFMVSGLSKNTLYEIYVVSVGLPALPSKPSELNAATDKDDSNTVPPINAKPVDLKTLHLSWGSPVGSTKRFWFKVFLKWKDNSIDKIQEIYSGRSRSYTFVSPNDLPFPQECDVIIMPPTLVKATVQNITIQSVTWNSAVITWQGRDSHVLSEVVDTYRVVITSSHKTVKFVTNKPKATIGGLEQMTRYGVNIQQGNSKGFGPLRNHNEVFRTPDANECLDLKSSCDSSKYSLVFDNSQCYSNAAPCDINAQCINTEGSFICKCNQDYIGDGRMCQAIPSGATQKDFCKEETSQEISWSRTFRGQSEIAPCPRGAAGIARRKCIGVSDEPATWGVPDLSNCVSKWAMDVNDLASDPSSSVLSVADKTANLTSKEHIKNIFPGDLKVIVNILGILSNRQNNETGPVNNKETERFTNTVVNTASNILDSVTIRKWDFIPETQRKRNAGSLLDTMDSVAYRIARTGNRSRTAMPNVVLDVFTTPNKTSARSVFIGPIGNKQIDDYPFATFPTSELNQGSQHVTYISYNTMGILLDPSSKRNASVGSSVVSLSVSGLKRQNFKKPVTIVFSHKQKDTGNSNSSCAFWDMTREPGFWSHDGCYVNSTNSSHTVCHCYHLTSFAVLMNVKGDTAVLIKGRHKIALELITYIGCVLSIAALCLTFVTFLTFRFLKSSRTFIHTNLSFVLILAQVVFLFGINKTSIKLVCQIIAGCLHYLWLSSFVWMALEGVMLYLMLVKVFGTKTLTKKKRIVFLSIGWCLPLIVVGVSAGFQPQGYGTKHYCWLSIDNGFIWTFVGPALLVIAFNFFIMGVTFSVMSRRGGHRRKPSKIRRIRYWAKACTLLTCILGLTWLFGVFYINHETLFMAYFFTIFNSLQGVFIFLFHCVGDEKIRREYMRILYCRDKGPAYTIASNSNSNSNSNSKPPKCDDTGSSGKLIKSLDKSDSKVTHFNTGSTGLDSTEGPKPVLLTYQKRSSYIPGAYNQEESESSQRISGELIENPRDSVRYLLAPDEGNNRNHYGETIQFGELKILQDVTVHNASADT